MELSKFFTVSNAIKVMLLFGVFALIGVFVQSCNGPEDPMERFAVKSLKKLTQLENPPIRPALTLQTLDGQEVNLEKHHGQIVLVNAWATWCPPCVAEMPSLDRLQALRGSPDFVVVPISLDRTQEEAKLWLEKNELRNLESWHDTSYRFTGEAMLPGLPTTILYNRGGREVARLPGEAAWDSEEALALIDYLIAQ